MTTQRTSPAAPAGTPRRQEAGAVSEPELFAGYRQWPPAACADPASVGAAVLDRITVLWKYRTWYRLHRWAEWTDIRRDDAVELRALVRLARGARGIHEHHYIGVSGALIGDSRTGYLADIEVCNCGRTRTPA